MNLFFKTKDENAKSAPVRALASPSTKLTETTIHSDQAGHIVDLYVELLLQVPNIGMNDMVTAMAHYIAWCTLVATDCRCDRRCDSRRQLQTGLTHAV